MKHLKIILSLLLILNFTVQNVYSQKTKLDRRLGKTQSEQLKEQIGIYPNKAMTKYISAVGNKLVAQLDSAKFDYHFSILDESTPNAFALPGGYIYITRGMLPLLQNEDELACVLSHEIIHAQDRHGIKKIRRKIIPLVLEIPGNLVGILNQGLGTLINAPIEIPDKVIGATQSRQLESQADHQGIILAAKAGYNPEALSPALGRLSSFIEASTGKAEQRSYFNDHPYTANRSKKINKLSANLTIADKNSISKDFMHEFDGIDYGDNPTKGIAIKSSYIDLSHNYRILFPNSWKIRKEKQEVIAFNKSKTATITCKEVSTFKNAKEAGIHFVKELSKGTKRYLRDSKPIVVNGKSAYLVSMVENNRNKNIYAYSLWMPVGKRIFQIKAIGTQDLLKLTEKSAASIRPLDKKDKKLITRKRLRVVKSTGNETIIELSKRTHNYLSPELTGIINDIDSNKSLKKGKEIRIVVEEAYY